MNMTPVIYGQMLPCPPPHLMKRAMDECLLYQNRFHKKKRMFWIEVSEINRAVTQHFSVFSKGDRTAPPSETCCLMCIKPDRLRHVDHAGRHGATD